MKINMTSEKLGKLFGLSFEESMLGITKMKAELRTMLERLRNAQSD